MPRTSQVAPLSAHGLPLLRSPPRYVLGTHARLFVESFAEFLGTLVLCAFGTGGNCQYAVANPKFNTYATVPIAWAMGIALGNGLAGGISGGHINPAVTVMLALVNKFPWWKVPFYAFAQVAGAFVGAAITYGVYYMDINAFEGDSHVFVTDTAGLFGTYPSLDSPAFSCWLAEFFPATILLGTVLFLVSMKEKISFATVPMVLFVILLGVGCTFGSTTSFSINPARDLGPRLLTYAAGYGPSVWDYKNQYWVWGAQMGAYSASVFVALCFWTHRFVERNFLDTVVYDPDEASTPPIEEKDMA